MRRSDREIKDPLALREIIRSCPICRIAMNDGDRPYIVPLNFGYSFEGDQLTLYFHSAPQGKKIDLLRSNPNVSFEMDCNHQLLAAEKACQYGFRFASIIGSGQAQFIEETVEKSDALNAIMAQQTGKTFAFSAEDMKHVCVFKIIADSFSGKKKA